MANRTNPLEDHLFTLASIRRRALTLFMSDGELCSRERELLADLEASHASATDIRSRQHLAELIVKGGDPTPYMNRIAEPTGMKITRIDAVRESDKIVQFPRNDEMA